MKKITIMTIVLAILLTMTTVVFAAEETRTNTTATVTAPAEVKEGATVDVTVTFANKVALGEYKLVFGTPNVLEFVSDSVGSVARGDGRVFSLGDANATNTIVIKCKVSETAKAGASTTVEFVPVEEGFGGSTYDIMTVTVSGKPEVKVVGEETPAEYTVTFKDADGKVIKTEKVAEGKSATAPAAPAREGYEFTGWDVEFTKVTSDMTVTAQYKKVEKVPSDDDDNKENTPSKNETVVDEGKDEDGKPTKFDQTGLNVAVVGAIALMVVIGSAVVIKRK